RFHDRWDKEGLRFLSPMLNAVLERFEEDEALSSKLARSLLERAGATAPRDAASTFAFLHRLNPADAELPVLAALAQARWVKRAAEERRGSLGDAEREELSSALAVSKEWVQRAVELGADAKNTKKAEQEIAEAENALGNAP
ncbi:MAG: hypothetical protein ACE5JI_18255, partial [Acidobacteriota bacterium]